MVANYISILFSISNDHVPYYWQRNIEIGASMNSYKFYVGRNYSSMPKGEPFKNAWVITFHFFITMLLNIH